MHLQSANYKWASLLCGELHLLANLCFMLIFLQARMLSLLSQTLPSRSSLTLTIFLVYVIE